MPSGERYGGIKDPCGNFWWVATHMEDLSPEEQERRVGKRLKNEIAPTQQLLFSFFPFSLFFFSFSSLSIFHRLNTDAYHQFNVQPGSPRLKPIVIRSLYDSNLPDFPDTKMDPQLSLNVFSRTALLFYTPTSPTPPTSNAPFSHPLQAKHQPPPQSPPRYPLLQSLCIRIHPRRCNRPAEVPEPSRSRTSFPRRFGTRHNPADRLLPGNVTYEIFGLVNSSSFARKLPCECSRCAMALILKR